MITFFEKTRSVKYLLLLLLATSFVLLLSNVFGKNSAAAVSDWLNVLVSSSTLILGLIIAVKTGKSGSHAKAWILFAACIGLWFIGERIWMLYEMMLDEKPWPSPADYFWLAGYAFFFAFSFYYMKPFKNSISRKMVIVAMLVPAAVLSVTLYVTEDSNSSLETYEKILANAYPVLDSLSLVPVILGLTIFFRGQVHFFWILLFLGMLCFIVSDLGYLYLSLDNSYYTGHPIDIPYMWAYVLFSLGIWGHLKAFSGGGDHLHHDQEKFR